MVSRRNVIRTQRNVKSFAGSTFSWDLPCLFVRFCLRIFGLSVCFVHGRAHGRACALAPPALELELNIPFPPRPHTITTTTQPVTNSFTNETDHRSSPVVPEILDIWHFGVRCCPTNPLSVHLADGFFSFLFARFRFMSTSLISAHSCMISSASFFPSHFLCTTLHFTLHGRLDVVLDA